MRLFLLIGLLNLSLPLTLLLVLLVIYGRRELRNVLPCEGWCLMTGCCDHDTCWIAATLYEGGGWALKSSHWILVLGLKDWRLLTERGLKVQIVVSVPETVFKDPLLLGERVALGHRMIRRMVA